MATNKDKLIAGAQKLVEKGQFEKAIKEYLKVVQTDDKDVRIWLKIGDLYAKLGHKAEAAETYQKVAQFYSDQGFYLKSVAVYKQILKIDGRLVEVNQRLAELYKQLGLLSDAMMQYETVAAHYHREGRTRDALAALKQIVELDPETVANRIKLAELYSKEQMPREAIEEFSKAAEQLREAGRVDDFMKVAERLLFHSPDNRPVSKELARLYIEKGDPRRALPKLQVCFKADPRDTEVLGLLAQAFEALDQRAKAVSVLKELARILGENGDMGGRLEVYRKILDLEPTDPEAATALASLRRPPPSPVVPSRSPSSPWGVPAPQAEAEPPPPEPAADEFDDPRPPSLEEDHSDPGLAPPGSIGRTAVGQLLDASEARAGHEDEQIERILNETDVYIKYKLFTKAIEHVQRVFEHDAGHVEAREKLKALYLTVGKSDAAVLELWSLAESAEPGRQRRYLREILELDPSNERAAGLLGVEPEPPGTPPREGSGLTAIDPDQIEELADDEFSVAEPSGITEAPEELDDDLIPVVVEPMHERGAAAEAAPAPVEDRFGFGDGEEENGAYLEPMPLSDSEIHAVSATAPANPRDSEEHDLHTRFDDQAVKFLQGGEEGIFGGEEVDEADLPPMAQQRASGTATTRAPGLPAAAPEPSVRATSAAERVDTASLEDDLDEADFFVQQNLFDEARTMLESLLTRYPAHPLVSAKLRDLEAMERAAAGSDAAPVEPEPEPEPEHEMDEPSSLRTREETAVPPARELAAELPDGAVAAAPESTSEPIEMTRRGMIEKGVTAEDFETHYDLGIAYKEMGLLDDAISEFKQVMKDASREVQCHLMIGLCCLEKGLQTEAIGHFKKGLYVEGITDREALSLYFELGQAYEKLNDPREALYYYEKVSKRDPRFRNVEKHVAALRAGGAAPSAGGAATPGGDDVDSVFDSLLDDA